MSSKKRKRAVETPNAKDAFIELRETGLAQTGPKRPNTTLILTPSSNSLYPTTVKAGRGRGRGRRRQSLSLKKKRRTPSGGRGKGEAIEAASHLMEGADLSDLIPSKGTPLTLTPITRTAHSPPPTPQSTPSTNHNKSAHSELTLGEDSERDSMRKLKDTPQELERGTVESANVTLASPVFTETPAIGKMLKSALKTTTNSLSLSRHSPQESMSKVSFGSYVTVAEFSPDVSMDSSTTDEQDLGPLEEDQADLVEPPSPESDHHTHAPQHTAPEALSESDKESSDDEEELGVVGEEVGVSSEEEDVDDELSPRLQTPHWKERGESGVETHLKEETPLPLRKSTIKKAKVTKHSSQKKRAVSSNKSSSSNTLPRSLIKNLFMLFTKRRLTNEAMDLVMEFSEAYLKQASKDVLAFAEHAGRKTIEIDDVVVLLQRQREVTQTRPFQHLVNTYLPMEYVEQLFPFPKP